MRSLLLLLALVVVVPARAQTWPDLHEAAAVQGGGEADAAVVVGISDYLLLPKVAGASDNAVAWQEWLLRSRKLKPENVVTLLDKDASRGRIERGLAAMQKQVGAGGTLWFVFIGHGAPAPSGTDGLLLGVDTAADTFSLEERGVTQQSVLAILEGGAHKQSVAVFDACFSGTTSDGKPLVAGTQSVVPNRKKTQEQKSAVFSASDSFAGPLPRTERPAFSYLLLGALRGWADDEAKNDDVIDSAEALAFTRGTMQAAFKSDARLPSHRGANVTLAKKAQESKPEVESLIIGRCPSSSAWDGRKCRAAVSVTCPEGYGWDGGACAARCPENTDWNGATCMGRVAVLPRPPPPPVTKKRQGTLIDRPTVDAARWFSPTLVDKLDRVAPECAELPTLAIADAAAILRRGEVSKKEKGDPYFLYHRDLAIKAVLCRVKFLSNTEEKEQAIADALSLIEQYPAEDAWRNREAEAAIAWTSFEIDGSPDALRELAASSLAKESEDLRERVARRYLEMGDATRAHDMLANERYCYGNCAYWLGIADLALDKPDGAKPIEELVTDADWQRPLRLAALYTTLLVWADAKRDADAWALLRRNTTEAEQAALLAALPAEIASRIRSASSSTKK